MAGGFCNKTLEISCVAPCSGKKYTAGTKDYRLGKASREWYVSAITEELSRIDETVTRSVPCFSVLILILRSSQNLGFQSTPALLKSSWGLRGRGQTKFVGHQDASSIKHRHLSSVHHLNPRQSLILRLLLVNMLAHPLNTLKEADPI